jgi:hypothetical protein
MFEDERLPFPRVPAQLAASLQQQGPGWFATRHLTSTPYDLDASSDATVRAWDRSARMNGAVLQELDDVIAGRRLLKAASPR